MYRAAADGGLVQVGSFEGEGEDVIDEVTSIADPLATTSAPTHDQSAVVSLPEEFQFCLNLTGRTNLVSPGSLPPQRAGISFHAMH